MFSRLSELTSMVTSDPVAIEPVTVTEARREGDLSSMIEKYCDMQKLYHFEGESGIRKFGKIYNVLGYRSLDEFLADNSGAIQAMIEWIGTQRNTEWVQAFENEGAGEDEESDDDGDSDDDK